MCVTMAELYKLAEMFSAENITDKYDLAKQIGKSYFEVVAAVHSYYKNIPYRAVLVRSVNGKCYYVDAPYNAMYALLGY